MPMELVLCHGEVADLKEGSKEYAQGFNY